MRRGWTQASTAKGVPCSPSQPKLKEENNKKTLVLTTSCVMTEQATHTKMRKNHTIHYPQIPSNLTENSGYPSTKETYL